MSGRLGCGRGRTRYFAWGLAGAVAGATLVGVLTGFGYASQTAALIIVWAPQISFLLGLKLAHIIAGQERIVLYELLLASLAGTWLALLLWDQPVGSGLDLTILGIGLMLVGGRIGCLSVGCCYGRPCRWGITYHDRHSRHGFPGYYVGVRLFPAPVVESVIHLFLVALGLVVLTAEHPGGEVLGLYLVLYGFTRFNLELLRGDPERPMVVGLSEAQWIALATAWACAGAGLRYDFDYVGVYLGVAGTLSAATAILILLWARTASRPWLCATPAYMHALARALEHLRRQSASQPLAVVETRAGIRLSYSRDETPNGPREHFTVSLTQGELSEPAARCIAQQIRLLGRGRTRFELLPGQHEPVYHILFVPHAEPPAATVGRRGTAG